jgi:hypothetical protein
MINETVFGTTVKRQTGNNNESLLAGELSTSEFFSCYFLSDRAFQTVRLAKGLFCSLLQARTGLTTARYSAVDKSNPLNAGTVDHLHPAPLMPFLWMSVFIGLTTNDYHGRTASTRSPRAITVGLVPWCI